MTKTHTEIAVGKDIEEIISNDERLNKNWGKNEKLDFYLFEELFNEFTMILGNLKTLCRGFLSADPEVVTGLPDLMLVNIQSGNDALCRIWDKAIPEKAPETEASLKDSPGA